MGKLRLASGDTKRLDLGDGDYLEVSADLSKRQFNELMSYMPNRTVSEESGLTPTEGAEFTRGLFTAFVKGWSLPDEPTIENYDRLATEAASIVDTALVEHFRELTPTDDERLKAETTQDRRRKAR